MNRGTSLLAILPLVLAACAPRAASSAPGNAPRLIGCPDNLDDLQDPGNLHYSVTVRVDATGKVIPGSAQVSPPAGHAVRSSVAEQQARTRAEGCTFTPATRDGVAVESRAVVRLRVRAART